MIEIEDIADFSLLNDALHTYSKVSGWKESVQRYKANLLLNNLQLRRDLLDGTYTVSPTTNFQLIERGRLRFIKAPHIRDRIVQKALMVKALLPFIAPKLIYDNYASLKGRGTKMARQRMEVLLHRYMRKNGTDGYLLKVDIRKYFNNINHQKLEAMLHKELDGKVSDELMRLIDYVIDSSSDGDVELNLGSEDPQLFAIFYLYRVDTYIKIVKGIKYYGRYMDDMWVLGRTKEELKELLADITAMLGNLGLEVNERKTQIIKLSHGFTWLQTKYNVTTSGKIITRLVRSKVQRERKRLRGLYRQLGKGKMTGREIYDCYQSWRGSTVKSCNACRRTITEMDRLYVYLFGSGRPEVKRLTRSHIYGRAISNAEAEELKYAKTNIIRTETYQRIRDGTY